MINRFTAVLLTNLKMMGWRRASIVPGCLVKV